MLTQEQLETSVQSDIDGYNPTAIWQDIQGLAHVITPEGNPISNDVEELQAQTVQKVTRARRTVDDTMLLLGEDLLTATFWLDVRRAQSPGAQLRPRSHGGVDRVPPSRALAATAASPTAAARRKHRPHAFMTTHPAAEFHPALAREIDADR